MGSKAKSSSSARKRFRLRGSSFKFRHAFTSHRLTQRSAKRKRKHRLREQLAAPEARRVRKSLPYLAR